MTSHELSEWMAYFRLENEDMDKRQREASAVAGADARARKALRK